MARYRIGETDLKLDVVGACVRDAVLPMATADGVWAARNLEFDGQRMSDLQAFMAAGWRFSMDQPLDWDAIRLANPTIQPVSGLLARHPSDCYVILRDHLVVKLASGMSQADIEHLLARYPTWSPLDFGENLFEVKIEVSDLGLEGAIEHELDILSGAGTGVVFAEPSVVYHLTQPGQLSDTVPDLAWPTWLADLDPFPQWQWGKIELSQAWEGGHRQGEGTRVAVIDLGFHANDPEIAPNVIWKAYLNQNGKVVSRDLLPPSSHGTFCASLVAARRDGMNVNGVAPQAGLILIAVQPEGVLTQVGLARALRLAAVPSSEGDPNRGADVISCSLGLPQSSWEMSKHLREAIDFVHAKGRSGRGTSVVWAVFNADREIQPGSVEAYEPLLCVSQCNRAGMRVASGYGEGLDFLAPGFGVVGNNGSRILPGWGSSLAAPCVAGIAALMLSVNPNLTREQIARVLSDTCNPPATPKVWNRKIGWGRVDARRAVEAAVGLV